jgi:hypothetical protein
VNRAWVQVLAWGIYLAVLTVILWIWWGHWLSVVQLGSAAVATGLIALAFVLVYRQGRLGHTPKAGRERRMLADLSPGAALTGIALCGMLYGAEFGFFLVLICGGLLVLGLAQLGIELWGERQRKRGDL